MARKVPSDETEKPQPKQQRCYVNDNPYHDEHPGYVRPKFLRAGARQTYEELENQRAVEGQKYQALILRRAQSCGAH